MRKEDILLFVHGYNNTFEFALLRCAQFVHDIHFAGTPLLFSWPSSGGTFGVVEYKHDKDMAEQSYMPLADVLSSIIEQSRRAGTNVGRIHVVAHSMGNRVLLHALAQLHTPGVSLSDVFGHIVLAAPDIDDQEFAMLLPSALAVSQSVTCYSCTEDRALIASAKFNGAKRVGQKVFCFDPLVSIQADHANTSLLGHDYFVSKSLLLIDLQMLLVGHKPPSIRETIELRSPPNGCKHWTFP